VSEVTTADAPTSVVVPSSERQGIALAAYRWTAMLGVFVDAGFAILALTSPDLLGLLFGVERVEFSYVWLGNLAVLLLARGLFVIACARRPERLRALAWVAVLGEGLICAYWLGVVLRAVHGTDFLPLFVMSGLFAVVPGALLTAGLASSDGGARAVFDRMRGALAARPRNTALLWFRRVALLGLLVNAAFIFGVPLTPGTLRNSLGAEFVDLGTIWLGAVAVMLFAVSLLYVPAALEPESAPGVSWLLIVSRALSGAYWVYVATQPDRAAFWSYFATDAAFGLVLAVLLQMGSAPEMRISARSLGGVLRGILAAIILRSRPAAERIAAAVVAVATAVAGYFGWYYFVRQMPDPSFTVAADQFKYGVIGLGPASRIPLYVWEVMPQLCPDELGEHPDGWATFGMLYEPGHDTPIGFAHREIGYPVLEPNCSLCHTGSYRVSLSDAAHVIPGGPAHQLDLQRFQRFLYACVADQRFNGASVVDAVEKKHALGPVGALVYRFGIVPTMQLGLARQQRNYAWQQSRPEQGPGRTDTFNPTKINVFHLPDDATIGTTDLPAVWNQAAREHLWLHWDGNNDEIRERNFAAAMAVGATPDSVQTASFTRVTDYLLTLAPAPYPFPIDQARATRGQVTYESQCAGCHAFGGASIGQTTPLATVGTDPHRLDSFSAQLVSDFHEVDLGPFKFDAYRKTHGYSNVPIDGIWARGPYLHHGAVPSLRDLLSPPAERPRVFYRGYNVYNRVDVGFVSQGPDAEANGWRYDVTVPGNDNGGHTYGTQLSAPDRDDLLEYLKTL
jgi:hypothetical protein